MSDSLLADIVRKNGTALIEKAAGRLSSAEAEARARSGPLGKLARVALLRVATRSVPGALVVGGALLAKHLHDRRQQAKAQGNTGTSAPGTAQNTPQSPAES